MTYTERRLAEIAEHIYTLRRMMRTGGGSQISHEILVSEAQQIPQHWFGAESEALLRAFRNIGHEVAALPDSFRDNHPEVPWSTMAAWADDAQFPDSSFSLPLFQQWLQVAITSEAAILRHTGAETEIQQAIIAQSLRRTDALTEQWRNSLATPHIFLWVTVVILGAWFSTLSLLGTAPSITEGSLLGTMTLSCVTMVLAARPTKPSLRQLFPTGSDGIHTFSELYDQSLEFYSYNTFRLEWEIKRNSIRWKRRERQWALATTCFLVAAICARIFPIP